MLLLVAFGCGYELVKYERLRPRVDSTQSSNEKRWCNNDLQVLAACDVGVNGEGVGEENSQEMVAFHPFSLSSPLPSLSAWL